MKVLRMRTEWFYCSERRPAVPQENSPGYFFGIYRLILAKMAASTRRPSRRAAVGATKKLLRANQSSEEEIMGQCILMGFGKRAVELAIYEQGYKSVSDVVSFLLLHPSGRVIDEDDLTEINPSMSSPEDVLKDEGSCSTVSLMLPVKEELSHNDSCKRKQMEDQAESTEGPSKLQRRCTRFGDKSSGTPVDDFHDISETVVHGDEASSSSPAAANIIISEAKLQNAPRKPTKDEKVLLKLLRRFREVNKSAAEEKKLYEILNHTIRVFSKSD